MPLCYSVYVCKALFIIRHFIFFYSVKSTQKDTIMFYGFAIAYVRCDSKTIVHVGDGSFYCVVNIMIPQNKVCLYARIVQAF